MDFKALRAFRRHICIHLHHKAQLVLEPCCKSRESWEATVDGIEDQGEPLAQIPNNLS